MAKKPVNIIGLKRQKNILMERHAEFVELAKTSTMEQLMAHFERSRSTIARHLNMYNIPHVTSRSNAPPARMYFVENRWIIRINKVKPSGEGCRGDNWGGSFLTKEDAEAAIQEVVRLGPTEYIARYRATLAAKREATRQKNTPQGGLSKTELKRIAEIKEQQRNIKREESTRSWLNSPDFLALSYTSCYI
jgi:hypothetical protein